MAESLSLKIQNMELLRLIELKQPEALRAIDAHDAAFSKLNQAQKVLKDLLGDSDLAVV